MAENQADERGSALSRRQILRGGAVGAAVWTAPVVSAVLLTSSTAQAASPFPNPGGHEEPSTPQPQPPIDSTTPTPTPAATPTPEASTPVAEETVPVAEQGPAPQAAGPGGSLAMTGGTLMGPVLAAGALVAGGAAVVRATRSAPLPEGIRPVDAGEDRDPFADYRR